MARSPLQPVSRGQRIELLANEHNAFIDAALATKRGERRVPRFDSGGMGLMPTSPAIIRVRNGTAGLGPGTDFDRFDIVGLSEPIFLPEESEPSFINETGFKAVIPQDPTHVGRFAVLLEPLAIGRIGRAVIAGMVTCRIADATAVAGDGLDIKHNDRTGLTRTPGGAATLLWRESGSGGWGLVHLGQHHPSVLAGYITAVTGSTNATYDVRATISDRISLSGTTPINRVIPAPTVTWNPAAVNDPCLLVWRKLPSPTWAMAQLTETIQTDACT